MTGELISAHLLNTRLANSVRVSEPDSVVIEAICPGTVVVLDRSGVRQPFEFSGKLAGIRQGLHLFLLVEHPSDYLVFKGRQTGYAGILSSCDGLAAWDEAFKALGVGFFVSPGARPRDHDRFMAKLTPRQLEVFELSAGGATDMGIAETLGIAVATVEFHRTQAMRNLDCHEWSDMLLKALRHGVVTTSEVRIRAAESRCYRERAVRARPQPRLELAS